MGKGRATVGDFAAILARDEIDRSYAGSSLRIDPRPSRNHAAAVDPSTSILLVVVGERGSVLSPEPQRPRIQSQEHRGHPSDTQAVG